MGFLRAEMHLGLTEDLFLLDRLCQEDGITSAQHLVELYLSTDAGLLAPLLTTATDVA